MPEPDGILRMQRQREERPQTVLVASDGDRVHDLIEIQIGEERRLPHVLDADRAVEQDALKARHPHPPAPHQLRSLVEAISRYGGCGELHRLLRCYRPSRIDTYIRYRAIPRGSAGDCP